MKSFSRILAPALVLVLAVSLTGCLSGMGSSSTSVDANKTTTINMYVNIPTDTTGIAALALVKVANGSFADPTSFTFTGSPSADAIKPVLTYAAYCEAVKSTLGQISGNTASVKYNSKKDGSGYALDFSSTNAVLRSLLIMAAYDLTNVYAIYTY